MANHQTHKEAKKKKAMTPFPNQEEQQKERNDLKKKKAWCEKGSDHYGMALPPRVAEHKENKPICQPSTWSVSCRLLSPGTLEAEGGDRRPLLPGILRQQVRRISPDFLPRPPLEPILSIDLRHDDQLAMNGGSGH